MHHGQRKHLVEHVDAALEVLELLKQRDHVELGDILFVCERQVGKLEDVGHMLGTLGERDDVAVRHLLAVTLLDGADSAEGVDDLARHGLQVAMDTVLVDILEGAGMYHGVLTELHLDHMEAEGLDLPDDGLDRAVGSTDGTASGQRALDDTQVLQELIGAVVHGIGDTAHGGVQTVGHDEHDGAMRLVLGNQLGASRVLSAHLDLMVPQVHELCRRLAVGGLERKVAADAAALVLELEHHVREVLGGDLAAHLGGNVGVTVAVGTDPAAGMEERRAQRRHGTGLVAQHPVVKTTVDDGDHIEQCAIEDVDDGIGFLDRRGLLERDGARAHQSVNLLQHMALVLHQVGAAQTRTLLQQVGDTANLALDGLTTGLGGMCGKDRVELELAEQLVGALDTHLVYQPVIGDGELVGGIDLGIGRCAGLALAQLRHTVVLLRQVCQVEEARKGANDDLLLIERQTVDKIDDLTECHGGGLVGGGHALLVDGLVGSTGAGFRALATISAVRILSNRSAISGSYSLSTRRSRRKNSAKLSRSSSGISISARRSLDSAFEPIRLTRRLTTAATRAAASGTDWLLRFSATFPPIPPSMHVTCGIHYRRLRNTFDTDCALPHKSIFCIARVFALNGRISRWAAYVNRGIPHKSETPP